MKVVKIVLGLLVLCLSPFTYSQDVQKAEITLSADLASSYVWRGFKQASASIQPSLGVEYKEFSLSGWASTDIAGKDKKEVDFTLGYSTSGLKASLTDYWWDGEYANRYFSSPREGNSGHMLELSISYTLPESFPLSLSWNTFLLGEGNKKADGKNSYSTYVELAYPFAIKDVDLAISAGFIPWESSVYGPDMDGFNLVLPN